MRTRVFALLVGGLFLLTGTDRAGSGGSFDSSLLSSDTSVLLTSGGRVEFRLDAGPSHAGKRYVLAGTLSGTTPGITLPGGGVLPLNPDGLFHFIVHNTGSPRLAGFHGTLDGNGRAAAVLDTLGPLPPWITAGDTMHFAFSTVFPFDLQSNSVAIEIDDPPGDYRYDDGSSEGLLGWVLGGDFCWMHRFEAIPGCDTITDVQCIFGTPYWPGQTPGNGTPCEVFVWDDPTDDGDPADCVLLAREPSVVQNVDTDIYNVITLASPVTVSGEFYVGCALTHSAGEHAAPLDHSTPYVWGDAFCVGSDIPGGFDPLDLMNNTYTPMEFGAYWCLRAGY